MNILVVEDEDDLRKLYEKILNFNGCKVIASAKDGKEAVQKFSQLPQKPDIIFMDYKMPVKNGIDAMKEILQIDSTARIFFISADATIKDEVLAQGAIGFETKPMSLNKFTQIIKKFSAKRD